MTAHCGHVFGLTWASIRVGRKVAFGLWRDDETLVHLHIVVAVRLHLLRGDTSQVSYPSRWIIQDHG